MDDDYLDFTVGATMKEDIWEWFDHRHSKGVHFLLEEYEISSKIEDEECI